MRLFVVLALLGLALAGCPQNIGFTTDGVGEGGGDGDGDGTIDEDPYWCCDPDEGQCVCPGYWRCTDGIEGKVCRQSNPPLPDGGGDGSWTCEYDDDLIVCEGMAEDHPDAGQDGDWTCERDAADGSITCSRAADDEDYPDEGGVTEWDCSFSGSGQARACREGSESGSDDGEWDCMTSADGQTVCSNDNPEQPDDGEWRCFRRDDGSDVCEGSEMPDEGDAEGWDCVEGDEGVTCENPDGDHPDAAGEGGWDCTWNEAGMRCHDNPGGGGDIGGEGEGENPDEGGEGEGENPDEGGEGEGEVPDEGGGDDCECIGGAQRYCDEPDYCLWGTQVCVEWFGIQAWGPCIETDIPAACRPGGALAQDYEWHYEGGFWDGPETRAYDGDGDGIIVYPPDHWFNPAGEDCAIRAGECAQDMWDLDQDGDNQESIGDCLDIQECV